MAEIVWRHRGGEEAQIGAAKIDGAGVSGVTLDEYGLKLGGDGLRRHCNLISAEVRLLATTPVLMPPVTCIMIRYGP